MNNKKIFHAKFFGIVDFFKREASKIFFLVKKMLLASRMNTQLHRSYELMGRLAVHDLKVQGLQWNQEKAQEILKTIEKLEQDLAVLEQEVVHFKQSFSSSGKRNF